MQSHVCSCCLIVLLLGILSVWVVADLYDIALKTQDVFHAGTESNVFMTIIGNEGTTSFELQNRRGLTSHNQSRYDTNWYDNVNAESVGIMCGVSLLLKWTDPNRSGRLDVWFPESVLVLNQNTARGVHIDVTARVGSDKSIVTRTVPLNGGWSEWSEWTECVCAATKKRWRRCDNPKPGCGGANCTGNDTAKTKCPKFECTSATSPTTSTTSPTTSMTSTTPNTTTNNTHTTSTATTTAIIKTTAVDTNSTTRPITLTSTPLPQGQVNEQDKYAPSRYFIGYVVFMSLFVVSLVFMTIGVCIHLRTKNPPSSNETNKGKNDTGNSEGNNVVVNLTEIDGLPSNPQIIIS